MATESTSAAVGIFELPGDAVYPESVGFDPASGDAYVGSLADGAVYRLTSDREVVLWSPAGQDGRSSVAGVKVDQEARLWAAGGYEGSLLRVRAQEPLIARPAGCGCGTFVCQRHRVRSRR
jgi:hypothetical protein